MGCCLQAGSGQEPPLTAQHFSGPRGGFWPGQEAPPTPLRPAVGRWGGGTGRFTSGLSGNHPIPAPSHLPEGDLAELEEGWTGSLWLGTLAPLKARLWLPSRVSLREAPDGTRLGVSGVSRMLVGMEKGLGGQGCVLTLHTLELSSKTSPKLQTLGDGKGDSQRRLHSPGTRCLT